MLIFPPCNVFIVYSLALPIGITGCDKSPEAGQVIMQRQIGPEKQAMKRATIKFFLMGVMWSLTDAWTSWHLAGCELCAAAYFVMVSRTWAEVLAACAQSAVAVGSHAVVTCLWGERHLHCNYVQRSWSVWLQREWPISVLVVQSDSKWVLPTCFC